MPIIWRFLLGQYFKVLLLCVTTFLGVLLTTRLDDIAHFAALGTSLQQILWFTWHQIPYILPVVLPLSCLISVMLLIQRLSRFHELTALRACGLGIRDILLPILLAAAILAIGNFALVSEVATHSHLTSGLLKNQVRSVNPLLFLKNRHLRRLQGIHFESLGSNHLGESVTKAVIALPDRNNKRIILMLADELRATPDTFQGQGMGVISCLNPGNGCDPDDFIVENSSESITKVSDFMRLFYKRVWHVNLDQLQLPLLLGRLAEEKNRLQLFPQKYHEVNENIHSIYSEILRRFSIAIAVFTFSLMGAAFGMTITRNRSYKGILAVIALATFAFVSYFCAKGFEKDLLISSSLYILPHVIIISLSIWMLKRITRGIT